MEGTRLLIAMDDNHAEHSVYGPVIRARHTGDLVVGDSGLADNTFHADAGYHTAVLQASGQGLAVYRKLGFRAVGGYVEHAIR